MEKIVSMEKSFNLSSNMKKKKILSYCLICINVIPIIAYFFQKKLIDGDIERVLKYIPFQKANCLALNYALIFLKPFRSVFRYRLSQKSLLFRLLGCIFVRSLSSIEISGRIESGMLIFHNMGCVIAPYSAGKNLTVSQGVTIGAGKVNEFLGGGIDSPIIGNNVWICPNAVIFGGISIGNNVTIGAGCIVNKSIPDNCTVVGNPARIIRKSNERCNEML